MKIRKLKIAQNIAAAGHSRALKCSWVFAGANFIALWRRGVVIRRFLSLLYLHGAKHSLLGRRLGNPRGVSKKWAQDPFDSR